MNTGWHCSRNSSYNEEYIVEGYIENFNSNEEWWDAMSEYQFDGEIVILELTNNRFLNNLESQFDLGLDDLREIGNVKIGDWKNLTKIIGHQEVCELKKEYDDLEQSNWAVAMYYNKKFCTIVTSEEPYCI